MDPLFRYADIGKPASLVQTKHFKHIDPAAPEPGETEQQLDEKSSLLTLGDEALRMKIRDPVDKLGFDNQIQRRNEMQHQWWAASKEHCIGLSHRPKCRLQQHQI